MRRFYKRQIDKVLSTHSNFSFYFWRHLKVYFNTFCLYGKRSSSGNAAHSFSSTSCARCSASAAGRHCCSSTSSAPPSHAAYAPASSCVRASQTPLCYRCNKTHSLNARLCNITTICYCQCLISQNLITSFRNSCSLRTRCQ